jgi:hypothetical protein
VSPLRISERAHRVHLAQTQLAIKVIEHQEEYRLTDIEILQALAEIQATTLKYMLRHERHPDDPDKGADEE